jgi:hypothetical protein
VSKQNLTNPTRAFVASPSPADEYLTTVEAAARLKRSPKTLEYWRVVGFGPPYYRQRRAIRYLLSEVLAWGATDRTHPNRAA